MLMPGSCRKRCAARNKLGRVTPRGQHLSPLQRNQRGPLDGHRFDKQHRITRLRAAFGDQTFTRHLTQHGPADERAVQPDGDFGVPSGKADAERGARAVDLAEDGLGHRGSRLSRGQQHRRQKPARDGAHDGHVVCIDVDRVPPDLARGKRDRVRLSHQVMVTEVKDGGILACARPDDDARVIRRKTGQQLIQERERELAGG